MKSNYFMERKSLVGNKYGKLTVTEMIYGGFAGGKIRTQCRCVCDCGNEIITVSDRLTMGKKISCGCDTKERRINANRVDLSGQRFGRLVVLEMIWGQRPTKCICKCDCGNTVTVINTGLTSGKTNSCGCYQKDMASTSNTKDWAGVKSPYGVEFISRSRKNDTGQWLWLCKCALCGSVFEVLPAKVMNGHCVSCGCKCRSHGEQLIKNYLDSNHIQYIPQYTIDDCKYKGKLKFDFAVFENGVLHLLIEYDGAQHYEPVEFFGGEAAYDNLRMRDTIKDQYCEAHHIPLIRIPYYYEPTEIDKIISDNLSVETAVSA